MDKKDKLNTRFLITGGHMTPAFAVIDELKSRGYKDIHWVGHKYSQSTNKNTSAEYNIVTSKKIPFYPLTAGKFMIWLTIHNWYTVIRDWIRIPIGFVQSKRIISDVQPDLVISFGGYLALPVVRAAKKAGIKCLTHEQTLVSGKANKRIAKLADKVLLSWEKSKSNFENFETIVTGNPIRNAVFEVRSDNYKFKDNLPILYITGGNQGSYNLSRRIFAILPKLLDHFNVIHQTGNSSGRDTLTKARYIRDRLPFQKRYRYIPKDFIGEDEIGEVLSKADILFTRSGANTVSEVMALGKLSVLMPIKWSSGGEQKRNALLLEEVGLGKMCWQTDQYDEPERVYKYLIDSLENIRNQTGFNGKSIAECKDTASSLINLNAGSAIVDEIEELISEVS